jgi:hypothetical protein
MLGIEYILQKIFDLQLFEPDTSLRATGAAGGATTIILPAQASNKRWAVMEVCVSYDDTPTGGRLVVSDGANPIFDIDKPDAGAQTFAVFRKGSPGNAVSITLYAPGGSVVGKLVLNARVL